MTAPVPVRRVAVFNDTRAAGHYGCEIVMQQLEAGLRREAIEPVWFHPVRSDWRERPEAIPRRPAIDAIVVNGEGSIHHSRTRERAVYLSQLAGFAHDTLGVPAFLVNASIDAIDDATAAHLARFDTIHVRESASRRELARFGIGSSVVADLTLGLTPPAPVARAGICATDSVLADVATTLRRLARRRQWNYRRMSWPAPQPLQPPPDTGEFLGWLASHELAVTGRFHTVTLCLATGTPFVAVESNTHKISGLVDDVFGERRRLLPADRLPELDVAPFLRWTDAERVRLHDALARERDAVAGMFAAIRRAIDASA